MINKGTIESLGVISDRHTCALVSTGGTIHWYCPKRFDGKAIFSSLLDTNRGGFWMVEAGNILFLERQYQHRSSILRSYYSINGAGLTITDFMPCGSSVQGIVRKFSPTPKALKNILKIRNDYGEQPENYTLVNENLIKLETTGLFLHCSHRLHIDGETIHFTIPEGAEGWAFLGDADKINENNIELFLERTSAHWENVEALVNYHGPYENQVRDSLRALQQMVYEPSGGIIAAATSSLPEVIGGERNYDYRYVWMRDAALITSSLTQIITTGELEDKFISFIDGAMNKNTQDHVSCFYAIDQDIVPSYTRKLSLEGYEQSSPVQFGNSAADQFQLDAEANILIACSLIYKKFGKVTHWETVSKIADFICGNWQRKDNGIWEEEQTQHYTSSKAFAARGLELIAPYQTDAAVRERWLGSAKSIRGFIENNCKTANGGYAVYAGSQAVDVTAALFVPFGFDDAHSPAMRATIEQIESDYCRNGLYHRHLVEFNSLEEGAFLAGSCWMAHYYAIAGDIVKTRKILNSVLAFSNDLGFFAEEADTTNHRFLGNFPQTFVHSSFICAVNGYKMALEGKDSSI